MFLVVLLKWGGGVEGGGGGQGRHFQLLFEKLLENDANHNMYFCLKSLKYIFH